ncbi:MAG: hypothetical protein WBD07_15515 [Vicinamibacterales bacterium]
MWSLLESIENSGFVTWVREANTIWAYTTVTILHTFGLAALVGLSSGIALRTLGFAPDLPLAPMGKFFRIAWIGFRVNVISGVILVALDARAYFVNPAFYIKMLSVVVAAVGMRWLQTNVVGDPATRDTQPVQLKGRIVAGVMLASWAVAITTGRLTAYDGFIRVESGIAVFIVLIVLLVARQIIAPFFRRTDPT